MNDQKPWFLSKTILVQLIAALVIVAGIFYPPAAEFLKQYFAEAGMGWAILNIVLRVITKKEIS